MEFTVEQRISASPDLVQHALVSPDFITACAELPRLGGCDLLDLEHSGEKVRMRVHRRFTGELNRAVTAVIDPEKLTWIEEIVYDLTHRKGTHRIVPDNYADRLSCSYTTAITADGDGSRRLATGTVGVRAPLGHGRVEQAIVSGLEEYAQAEAELLGRWPTRG